MSTWSLQKTAQRGKICIKCLRWICVLLVVTSWYIWNTDMAGLYTVLALLIAALIGTAASANWSLEDAKLTISSIDGSGRISERWVVLLGLLCIPVYSWTEYCCCLAYTPNSFTISKAPSLPSPLEVNSDEVIRLAFTLQSSGGGKLKADELPHQVVVLLADAQDSLRTVSTIVTVKPSTGKASWNQASTDWYAICIALIAYLFFSNPVVIVRPAHWPPPLDLDSR